MSFDAPLDRKGLRTGLLAARKQPRRGLPKVLLSVMLLLSLTTLVGAQDGATQAMPGGIVSKAPEPEPAPAASLDPNATDPNATAPADTNLPPPDPNELGGAEFLKDGKPRPKIKEISPDVGPFTGDTKVIVRGAQFQTYVHSNEEPKCKFGE